MKVMEDTQQVPTHKLQSFLLVPGAFELAMRRTGILQHPKHRGHVLGGNVNGDPAKSVTMTKPIDGEEHDRGPPAYKVKPIGLNNNGGDDTGSASRQDSPQS